MNKNKSILPLLSRYPYSVAIISPCVTALNQHQVSLMPSVRQTSSISLSLCSLSLSLRERKSDANSCTEWSLRVKPYCCDMHKLLEVLNPFPLTTNLFPKSFPDLRKKDGRVLLWVKKSIPGMETGALQYGS